MFYLDDILTLSSPTIEHIKNSHHHSQVEKSNQGKTLNPKTQHILFPVIPYIKHDFTRFNLS